MLTFATSGLLPSETKLPHLNDKILIIRQSYQKLKGSTVPLRLNFKLSPINWHKTQQRLDYTANFTLTGAI